MNCSIYNLAQCRNHFRINGIFEVDSKCSCYLPSHFLCRKRHTTHSLMSSFATSFFIVSIPNSWNNSFFYIFVFNIEHIRSRAGVGHIIPWIFSTMETMITNHDQARPMIMANTNLPPDVNVPRSFLWAKSIELSLEYIHRLITRSHLEQRFSNILNFLLKNIQRRFIRLLFGDATCKLRVWKILGLFALKWRFSQEWQENSYFASTIRFLYNLAQH